MLTPEEYAEICAMQKRLQELDQRYQNASPMTNEGTTAHGALHNASNWLGDITNPLTKVERTGWEKIANNWCTDIALDMDASLINEGFTDADRRDALELTNEENVDDSDPENVYGSPTIAQSIKE